MVKNWILLLIVLVLQTSLFSCPSRSLYTPQLKAPIYAKSTQRFVKHINGDKTRRMSYGKSRLLITSGLHSIHGYNKHLLNARHLNYMLTSYNAIRPEFLETLPNGVLLAYLPQEAYTPKSFGYIKDKIANKSNYTNHIYTKNVDGKKYYSQVLFPEYMTQSHIEQASYTVLQDPRSIVNKTNKRGNTRVSGVYKTRKGDEISIFVVFNSNNELVTAYPNITSFLTSH